MAEPNKNTSKGDAAAARKTRLAAALKANLKKRKARARGGGGVDEPGED